MSLADSFLADLDDIVSDLVQVSDDAKPHFKSQLLNSLDKVRLEPCVERIAEASEFGPAADLELQALQQSVETVYSRRFPALIQIVPEPSEYLQVASRLGADPRRFTSFDTILSRTAAVALSVTSSTASPLTADELAWVTGETETALKLIAMKTEAMSFLQQFMPQVAPNLLSLLGVEIAARLAVAAGGVDKLATMPAQNIESVGASRRQGLGLSATAKQGLIWLCDIVQQTHSDYQKKAVRLLVSKAALAARADQYGQDPHQGERLRAQVEQNLEKCQTPGEARQVKILPVPIEKSRPKRGGARHRKMKEKYGASEFQKKMNRVKFGEAEKEDAFGTGLGMIGLETGGSLRGPREKTRKSGSGAIAKPEFEVAAPAPSAKPAGKYF